MNAEAVPQYRSLGRCSSTGRFDMDSTWPELVLHVLAHLGSTAALPSSLYSAEYVADAALRLGPASKRALADDVEVLAAQLVTHEQLVMVQLVARLHLSIEAAQRNQHLELAALSDDGETDLEVRDHLLAQCPVTAELLRCAALLEAPHFSNWLRPDLLRQQRQLQRAVPVFCVVAPRLRRLPVRMLRALGLRGRAWPDEIWVGIPAENALPTWGHVLWQASHESTVLEVAERAQRERTAISERGVEQLAVALLARRAARARFQKGHASWLSRMDSTTRDWSTGDALGREQREWLDQFG